MREIKLTDDQRKNLLIFLDRVEVKGVREASALIELVVAVKNAEDIEVNDTQVKDD